MSKYEVSYDFKCTEEAVVFGNRIAHIEGIKFGRLDSKVTVTLNPTLSGSVFKLNKIETIFEQVSED